MIVKTSTSCKINNLGVTLNKKLVFPFKNEIPNLESIYNAFDIQYPKFFKMDEVSQLCFLTTELLLKNIDITSIPHEQRAVLIKTKEGCIKADEDYFDSMHTAPSPAQFVYTLPNVMIGEICIRHKIKGENYCLVADHFDFAKQLDLIELAIPRDKIIINVDRYANTSAASIPIALCEGLDSGRIQPHQKLLMASFGAGLTWGTCVYQMAPAVVSRPQFADLFAELERVAVQ